MKKYKTVYLSMLFVILLLAVQLTFPENQSKVDPEIYNQLQNESKVYVVVALEDAGSPTYGNLKKQL